MTKIIYIAGAGRSGSTILGILLGSMKNAVHLGEIGLALEWLEWKTPCSCGKEFSECEFWKEWNWLDKDVQSELIKAKGIEHISGLPRLLTNLVSQDDADHYNQFYGQLMNYVQDHSGKEVIVDSSKTTWSCTGRFHALNRFAGNDVYVVHLVRNGYAVMESDIVTGDNRVLEGSEYHEHKFAALRSVVGWGVFNLTIPFVGLFARSRKVIRVHYEDLIRNPSAEIRRIGQAFDMDTEELAQRLEDPNSTFETGHLVGGNRVRHQKAIKLKQSKPRRYGEKLRLSDRLLFIFLFGWLQRFYGYSLRLTAKSRADNDSIDPVRLAEQNP